nr:unnamed protein product [Callosobruchus chinensis]CAH7766622.1 unnamed protein product [Callosobruchus chinensis]
MALSKSKSPTSLYIRKRSSHGEFALTRELNDAKFSNYFRLTREQFSEVHELIKNKIETSGSNAASIGTEEKLGLFLRYLASGNSYKSIGYSYRMGDRTVSTIVNLVSKAMWKVLKPLYMPEPTSQKWESIALDFQERWQFPHCVGAIDGKHVVIKKPTKTGSSYFNYKQTFSIVLMVATDSAYRFISIDVGSMGRFSDGNIFASSVLGKKIMKQTLKLPQPSLIPPIDSPIPYVFVADEAFPLLENVMRPFPRRSVTDNYERKVFNYRLSRARQTVECSFGILSSRFRIFQKPFEISVDSVVHVVKAACVLHNYLLINSPMLEPVTEEIIPIPQHQLQRVRANNNRSAREAFAVRQKFTDYFNSSGMVPWQRDRVLRGQY